MADFEDSLLENEPFLGGIGDMPGQNTNKRVLVLMIVDATTSMRGQSIGQVNYGIQELFSELREYASSNLVNLQIGILSFTNSVRWEMEPTDIQTCYDAVHIDVRPGLTQYGVVYHELGKMLNKQNLLKYSGKQAAPVLIFMTDGAPSDAYQDDLNALKKNGYFALSNRSAILMGDGANDPKARAAVEEFVSKESMILTAGRYTDIVQSIKLATLHTLKNDFQETDSPKIRIPEADPLPPENPFGGTEPTPPENPFGETDPTPEKDPFGGGEPTPPENPFGETDPMPEKDPFGGTEPTPSENPFGGEDPFAGIDSASSEDLFGGTDPDPFDKMEPTSSEDPFGWTETPDFTNAKTEGDREEEGVLDLEDPFAPKS